MRLAALLCLALLCSAAAAQEVTITAADSMQSVLTAQKGKRVAVRTKSGQELTGTVRDVNGKVAVIGAPTGREFFDAIVALDSIESVQVRTKP